MNYIVLPHFIMQTSVPKNVFIRRSTHLLTNGESNLQIKICCVTTAINGGKEGKASTGGAVGC